MQRADTLDQDVYALKQWLDAAWRRLADPSLTRFARQELRNQMKQNDAELRLCMQKVLERQQRRRSPDEPPRTFPRPADPRLFILRDPAPIAGDLPEAGDALGREVSIA